MNIYFIITLCLTANLNSTNANNIHPVNPVIEQIGRELRCPVCQGVPIGESPAPMAHSMMHKVRELHAQGKSREEILQYFVERYGEWVLLNPTTKGINWLLWLLPLIIFIFSISAIYFYISTQKKVDRINQSITHNTAAKEQNTYNNNASANNITISSLPKHKHFVKLLPFAIYFLLLLGFVLFSLYTSLFSSKSSSSDQSVKQQNSSSSLPPLFITAAPIDANEWQNLIDKISKEPNNVDLLVRMGHLLIIDRMYEEAQLVTERALKINSSNFEARIHAAALIALTDPQTALNKLYELLQTNPNFANGWLLHGTISMWSGHIDLMYDSFNKYIETAPDGNDKTFIINMLQQLKSTSRFSRPHKN
ncbi:MAG: cytochrome c-type biogenesis protein CcmH [Deltaproteobacteria bacterium]|nr:cytochrome c-type biogenesis protein CcmH [Deltaproteobacteria bacterium]